MYNKLKHVGSLVNVFVSGSSGSGSSPGRGHCAVFLGKTLYFRSVSLHYCTIADYRLLQVVVLPSGINLLSQSH